MVQAGWKDVPHLDEEEKRKLVANRPPYQIKARTEGEPALGVEAIYPIDEADISVPDRVIPDSWPRAFGMDVGWNRTAAVWGAEIRAPGQFTFTRSTIRPAISPALTSSMGEPPTMRLQSGAAARGFRE